MQIYPAEIEAGLEHFLQSSASISYASAVEKSSNFFSASQKDQIKDLPELKALAGINDSDLYYVQSILVSSIWNLNDDVFLKEEVWNARNTPVHKPTNLGHNENLIVGHITANWPMDVDGQIISEDTEIDNIPDKFHILTGSVIYLTYTEQELKDRALKLIGEIEAGKMYVSMECWFKGFDYAVSKEGTDEYQILPRTERTAFLTKHLKIYGGLGVHEGYRIGRLLRGITFSGKGYVGKPGNPESVIFTNENLKSTLKEKKEQFSDTGVFSLQANIKENTMTLEEAVASLTQKIEALGIETTKSNELAARISELETIIETKTTELAQASANLTQTASEKDQSIAQLTSDLEAKANQLAALEQEVASLQETVAAYKDKEAEMMKKEEEMKKKAKSDARVAKLVELGVDNEKAAEAVSKFENLDDDAFAAFSALFEKKDKKDKEEDKEDKSKSDLSDVLDNAEPDNSTDLTGGETTDPAVTAQASTKAALAEFVQSRLGKKFKKTSSKKGE